LPLICAKYQEYRKGTREEFISLLKSGTFDGAEAIFRSNESTAVRQDPLLQQYLKLTLEQVTGPFTEEIVSVLPSTVKYICHSGAGYDNIDVEACTKRGATSFFLYFSLPQSIPDNLNQESKSQTHHTATKML